MASDMDGSDLREIPDIGKAQGLLMTDRERNKLVLTALPSSSQALEFDFEGTYKDFNHTVLTKDKYVGFAVESLLPSTERSPLTRVTSGSLKVGSSILSIIPSRNIARMYSSSETINQITTPSAEKFNDKLEDECAKRKPPCEDICVLKAASSMCLSGQ